jgi:thiol:disulfide interchange protein
MGKRWSGLANMVTTLTNYGVAVALLWMMFIISRHYSSGGLLAASVLFCSAAVCFERGNNIIAFLITVALLAIPTKFPRSISCAKAESNAHGKSMMYAEGNKYVNVAANKIQKTIAAAVAQSKVVIFSIEADWCLTCKSNHSRIFGSERIQRMIKNKSNNILCLRADMTLKSDTMMNFIRSNGRVGIPFMMIFGPKTPAGILLGEIPTIDEVEDAIAVASGKNNK